MRHRGYSFVCFLVGSLAVTPVHVIPANAKLQAIATRSVDDIRLEPSAGGAILCGGSCDFTGTRTRRAPAGLYAGTPSSDSETAHEPRRGSRERAAILDAVRPEASKYLGAPVQFVVHDISVSGDRAYANLMGQRPGGIKIDLRDTPWGRGPDYDPVNDYPGMNVLLRHRKGGWTLAEFKFSWTEPPFADAEHCRHWRAVLPKPWCQ